MADKQLNKYKINFGVRGKVGYLCCGENIDNGRVNGYNING
jgi:hypothetical protein